MMSDVEVVTGATDPTEREKFSTSIRAEATDIRNVRNELGCVDVASQRRMLSVRRNGTSFL